MGGRSGAQLALLVAAFALLWAPWGQYGFLIEHWMKVGAFMAPFLLFAAASYRTEPHGPLLSDVQAMALILWVAYIAHQFEEHWIDLLGRPYAFQAFLNETLAARTGAPPGTMFASDANIFVINTGPVWLVGALAVWRAPAHVFPALCMAAIALVNAVSHTAAALLSLSYNPGLLTSVVVFAPLSIFFYRAVLRSGAATRSEVGASLAWSFAAHVVLIAGMIVSTHADLAPEPAYWAALVAVSILPVFLFRRPRAA